MKVQEQTEWKQAMGRWSKREMSGWWEDCGGEDRAGEGKKKAKESAGVPPHVAGRCSTLGSMGKCKEKREKEATVQLACPGVGQPGAYVQLDLHIWHPKYSAKCEVSPFEQG